MTITCIANNGSNGQPEVPLWICPCLDCTRLDWQAEQMFDDNPVRTVGDFRKEMFPDEYITINNNNEENTMNTFPAPIASDLVTEGHSFRDQWKSEANKSMRTRTFPLSDECQFGAEALAHAGIGWDVEAVSLADLQPTLEFAKNARKHFVAIRETDGAVLGVNGSQHQIIQNSALADLGDAIISERPEFRYVSGGASPNGQTTFLILESREPIFYGPNDTGARSMLLVNDFGGKYPLFVKSSDVRFSCMNQFALGSGKRLISIRHTRSGDWAMTAAIATLKAEVKAFDEMDKELYRLLNTPAESDDFREAFAGTPWPMPRPGQTAATLSAARNRYCAKVDAVRNEYFADWNSQHVGTAFGVVMAAQGYDEHRGARRHGAEYTRVNRVIKNNWPTMARVQRQLAAV